MFTNSNVFAIWMFLLFYGITIAIFCFFMTTLLTTAHGVTSLAGVLWFVSYTPFFYLSINFLYAPRVVAIFLCLMPNFALAYGCRIIVELEEIGEGLNFYNLFDSTVSESRMSVGETICLMLTTSIIWSFITFYIEKVLPESMYQVPEKWNFLFTKEFWKKSDMENEPDIDESVFLHPKFFEKNFFDSLSGVKIFKLRKEYGKKKVACNDLTFDLYHDQITVLLGHNGAGKSTLIKMLTGMISPTSGTALINGYDIQKERIMARRSIGICPQHNILFDELTVREHIEFYCKLKGLKRADVKSEVKKYVELLNLESKINAKSNTLSGGMQRKLAFAIALCGGSMVVLCDEPTSGMDPVARRELWNVLQSEKIGRTILLTTHFMDEADILGDRIVIMAEGEFKCGGTAFFLKKRFGEGYRLTCVKADGCDSSRITRFIQRYITDIEILNEFESEVSYIMRYEHAEHFEEIFFRLEKNLRSFRLSSYGISSAELEEVFLKLGTEKKSKKITNDDDKLYEEYDMLGGFRLILNQCCAMFKKRIYWLTRNWILFVVLHLILIFFIWMSFFLTRDEADFLTLPHLNISLDSYGDTVTMLQYENSSASLIVQRYIPLKKSSNEMKAFLNIIILQISFQYSRQLSV